MTARGRRPGRPRSAEFSTPLTIPGGELAGADLVRELPPEVALPVWQTLRSVLLWAGEEPAMRGDLFEPCAMGDWERRLLEDDWEPDVRCPLAVLVGEMGRLAEASPETIARTCLCVTDWALEHGYVATALAYAEAAALAWPQHPRYSWMAGRLMRAHGRPREADMWLKRAVRAAVTAGDWETQTLALNSLGNGQYATGDYQQAVKTYKDALKVARRHRLREREGEVLHDLFAVMIAMGEGGQAEEYAREAFELYRVGHPRLAALAHDVAQLWMSRGYFSRAFQVLKELLPHFSSPGSDPRDRFAVLASTARAAGACDDRRMFTALLTEASTLLESASPPALVDLALGASSVQQWDVAESTLLRAAESAGAHGANDTLERAEAALQAVRLRRIAEIGQKPYDPGFSRAYDQLARGFVSSLQATAPARV